MDNDLGMTHPDHNLLAAIAAAPAEHTPEATAVKAENLSAAGMEPKDLPEPKPAKTFIPFGI